MALAVNYRNGHLITAIRIDEYPSVLPFRDLKEKMESMEGSVIVEPIEAKDGIVKLRVMRIRYQDNWGIRGDSDIVEIDIKKPYQDTNKIKITIEEKGEKEYYKGKSSR